MAWTKWRMGLVFAVVSGLLAALAGLTGDMNWKGFCAVLATSLATNLMNFLAKHPIEEIAETDQPSNPPPKI